MIVLLTRQHVRIVLAGLVWFCGFALTEVVRLNLTSPIPLAFFACCLAAFLGCGKQASP
jgi:hypothetical protein